ncbi:urease accessory protein UreD [Chitinophaga rhizophila]|uniref:Urease accessory protein UreD n=1 Tax=Chitinophaga rhizophila TaxID=2866212 RepID=A0ABS7GAI3_9BACT|nr:urease accessory protein UreD [Chitinophaga rhizophila]MBW8684426.1 urease accessory protein UreD [Chitinophaga rhizophila]
MTSELDIHAAVRGARTFLQHSYYTMPFKVADISGSRSGPLHLTVMTASPGILDGDNYQISIRLDADAHVHLYTQAYQRIFQMKSGAKQRINVVMGKGSSLYYLPHPSVPHEHSVFDSASHIAVEEGCSLLWGEIITCGRKLSGEVFRCDYFRNVLELWQDKRLLFRDVTILEPAVIAPAGTGQWEGYSHQASLLWYNQQQDMAAMAGQVDVLLSSEENITGGVSRTACGALLVRVLGHGGEQLYELFKKIAVLAGQERKL